MLMLPRLNKSYLQMTVAPLTPSTNNQWLYLHLLCCMLFPFASFSLFLRLSSQVPLSLDSVGYRCCPSSSINYDDMFLLPIMLPSEMFKRRMSARRRRCDTLDCDCVHPRNVCVCVLRSWFRLCLVGGVSELING